MPTDHVSLRWVGTGPAGPDRWMGGGVVDPWGLSPSGRPPLPGWRDSQPWLGGAQALLLLIALRWLGSLLIAQGWCRWLSLSLAEPRRPPHIKNRLDSRLWWDVGRASAGGALHSWGLCVY